ncbi:MAG: hypothetical protein ACYCPQ_07925 [Elusimicrobiota bacterium]
MNKIFLRGVLLAGFFPLIFSACALEQDFQKAQVDNSLHAWTDFTHKYPVSQHPDCEDCKIAQQNYEQALASLNGEWKQAQSKGTASAYIEFMGNHSADNPYYQKARDKALDLLNQGSGKASDYLSYLSKYPGDAAAEGLRKKLMNVRLKNALNSGDEAGYYLIMAEYPGTAAASRVRRLFEKAEFNNAQNMGTRIAYEFFLRRFPNAPQADAAKTDLAKMSAPARVAYDANALKLLSHLREAAPALQGQECLALLAAMIKAQADPYGEMAERIRNRFNSGTDGVLPAPCRNRAMTIPSAHREIVANAVTALASLSRRQEAFNSTFLPAQSIADKARAIGKSAFDLSQDAEAFDLEMQAFYGYMPADPDHPHKKAASEAKEAQRRAKEAFELSRSGAVGAEKKKAKKIADLMNGEGDLLIKIIAYYEKPAEVNP